MRHINLDLRSQQIDYLEYLAGRNATSVSRVLGLIIETRGSRVYMPVKAAAKGRRHVSIDPGHLKLLDRLSVAWGLTRSDTARRLIDLDSAVRMSRAQLPAA